MKENENLRRELKRRESYFFFIKNKNKKMEFLKGFGILVIFFTVVPLKKQTLQLMSFS